MNHMKHILLMGLFLLPMLGFSQAKEQPKDGKVENKFAIVNPEIIYLELIIGTNSVGAQTIRVDFGREIMNTMNDKDVAKQLADMRSLSFPTVPDAMNYLASLGYRFQQNYQTFDKEGKVDTHIVYEKRLAKRQNPEEEKNKGAVDVNDKNKKKEEKK
jgi:hypothetical protein